MAHGGGHWYGWMTTNIVECINGVLKGARMLPITTFIRLTFYRCVKIFHYSNEIFEVTTTLHGFYMDKGNNIQIVKLKERPCTWNK